MILLFHNLLHFAKLLNKKYGTHTESRILHLHKIFYSATIATNRRPFACDLTIGYTTKLPNWVITSNFENNSLPKDSTTYGIKSLIEGVNNAYQNKDNNIFTINLSLK